MAAAAVVFVLVALALLGVRRWIERLPGKQKKALLKKTVNGVFIWFEERGWLPRTGAFNHEYLRDYPALAELEASYPAIREECLGILGIKDRLTDVQDVAGSYTEAGIHTIEWKAFVLKSGRFVKDNCERCPRTAAALRKVPGVYTAFFSVLDPHQYVTPHWGYYKGFARYHLGVLIPNDNRDYTCRLRVNGEAAANAPNRSSVDRSLIEKGESYYWKNGEGIVFDDNYLHDATNESDEVRVVLWVDLRRRMPWYLQVFNMLCLYVAYRDSSVKRIRRDSRVDA